MRRLLLAILAAGLLFALPATAPARDVSAPPKQPTAVGTGGFMTIYSARDGKVHTIDSRETAPAAMTPTGAATSFEGLTDFEHQRVSGMSVGVPGTLRAWETALREFGTTSLKEALEAGIE